MSVAIPGQCFYWHNFNFTTGTAANWLHWLQKTKKKTAASPSGVVHRVVDSSRMRILPHEQRFDSRHDTFSDVVLYLLPPLSE
uniref:Uncharacterized protein n=1 Tax=Anguilla anguilla TaxID=7936 RepID=A0A0E9X453_ANGAN